MASRLPPVVTLFTRPGCCICQPIRFIVDKVSQRHPLTYTEVNIDESQHEHWRALYTNDIPVVHVDGKEVARHRMDERQLIAALAKK